MSCFNLQNVSWWQELIKTLLSFAQNRELFPLIVNASTYKDIQQLTIILKVRSFNDNCCEKLNNQYLLVSIKSLSTKS